ncbi:hypothetical protein Egran_05722 [Elaphomyces granulatus]|uniref:Fe2OG dioxygenase domain-containing protein n=1 Tax=Elaphomyces granulatus TaxID=519963 RepID=A0A232LQS5_9EURO|nr:hypothetical protein Egran_05722 [Elaphomyces granulatus]
MAFQSSDNEIKLLEFPRAPLSQSKLEYAESFIVDLNLDDGAKGTEKLVETIRRSATDGLFHIVNHGIPSNLLELQRDVAYTYFKTTSLDQKDADTTKNGSGLFEGYKLRTPDEKEDGLTPTIEEYNYDYYATGKVVRPPIMEKFEDEVAKVYQHYHHVLIPKMMRLLSLVCGREPDHFYKMHDSSLPNSEIAHYLRYHVNWERDTDKKRASYAGHTDIGSVTFLYCNPMPCLQVYTAKGWRYVPYIENSIIVNIGDCLESLTGGKFPAALHRLVKFSPDQAGFERIALVYFVHPHDNIIREHFRLEQERRTTLAGTNMMSGQEVNRLIMALSADNEDPYAQIVDEQMWLRSKKGELVPAPEELAFDYDARTIRRRADAENPMMEVLTQSQPFKDEQWRVIQSLAREMAREKVAFDDVQWKTVLEILNRAIDTESLQTHETAGGLTQAQELLLERVIHDLKAKTIEVP